MKMNPGIVKTVEWLRAHGFKTTDSGDGETHDYGCDLPIPYVHMLVAPEKLASEAKRLQAELRSVGVVTLPQDEEGTVPTIEASYDPQSDLAVLSLYNVRL